MGGGPRTFPGGLNKWQWKRMHEKKACEKEKRLLDQEKQLYQARIRSQIRSEIVASDDVPRSSSSTSQPTHRPLSPQEQIKALADRFMKEGAEDLWNEDDGPVMSLMTKSDRNKILGESVDSRKSVGTFSSNDVRNLSSFTKSRHFSSCVRGSRMPLNGGYRGLFSMNSIGMMNVRCYTMGSQIQKEPKRGAPKRVKFARNESSESEDDTSGEVERGMRNPVPESKGRYPRFAENAVDDYDDSDSDSDSDLGVRRSKRKRMLNWAALGKYDKKKRIQLQFLEKEYDLSLQNVDTIRKEFNHRRFNENVEVNLEENQRRFNENVEVNFEEQEEESLPSSKRFDEFDISPLTVKALTEAGFVQMTRVHEAALTACFQGMDVAVKAKTGSGKSVAFLLPAIETVIKASKKTKKLRIPPVNVLIICPTRELASQISAEATVLLKYHDDIGVLTLVGGTRLKDDQRRLESDPSQIIIATPSRLLDHIENKSGFSIRLMGLRMLILDETDRLLNLGFRKELETIVDCLPRQRLQSMLFSARMPMEVQRICQLALKKNHAFIDTGRLPSLEINTQVRQEYVVAPHVEHFQIVHHLLEKHISEVDDYKVIVFCSTSMMKKLMFSFLREMKLNVREMHSTKPQSARIRISDEFENSKKLVMITSEVLAGGMNHPDVTLVIQVGIPPDRDQYIRRLGTTVREGKARAGVLLLAKWEEYFLDEIKDLSLERTSPPLIKTIIRSKMLESMSKVDKSIKQGAYHEWLSYYNSIRDIGRDKTTLVETANSFSKSIGLQTPPSLFKKTAIGLGLKDIPGIRIQE